MTTCKQEVYEFLNPYNFVSTPKRSNTHGTGQVGSDHKAPPRGRIKADVISGWVDVELRATSPILLSDFSFDEKREKVVRIVRISSDKRTPELLATSFKGALRSAYEAITNSRFGTFDEDHRVLGTERQTIEDAKDLKPAYIDSEAEDPKFSLQVLESVAIGSRTVSAAVKVPLKIASAIRKRAGTDAPQVLFAVVKLSGDKFTLSDAFEDPSDMDRRFAELLEEDKNPSKASTSSYYKTKGYLHWTGRTFKAGKRSKKSERFFITDFLHTPAASQPWVEKSKYEIDKGSLEHKKWKSVIESYQLNAGGLDDKKTSTAWDLQKGRTLWTKIQGQRPKGMSPSMIGRQAFDQSPEELALRTHHAPATKIAELSAADRVFGWVRTESKEDTGVNSLRGSVKIHQPVCAEENSIVEFKEAFPLAILSGAHTSQWRFYTTNGYADGAELSGRKFFLPHHPPSEFSDYWGTSRAQGIPPQERKVTVKTGTTWHREYLSVGNPAKNDKVHTWIKSWVKPGTSFNIRITLENLEFEDAAFLIWLLDLSNHTSSDDDLAPQIGIGFGKPLGFGSMTMKIKDSCLSDGSTWKQRYSSLSSAAAGTGTETGNVTQSQLIQVCEDLVQKSADLSSIQERFLAVASGWKDIPVHYPRESASRRQKGYKWFTENKKADNPQVLPEPKKNSAPILKTHK